LLELLFASIGLSVEYLIAPVLRQKTRIRCALVPVKLLYEQMLTSVTSVDNFWEKWKFLRLNFKSKLDLCHNVADGLLAMHECGVVHGDVKPENILIFPSRTSDNAFVAKLTDFGHSVFANSGLSTMPAFTPMWCAPELSPGMSSTKRMTFQEMKQTDYYSYGLVVLSIMIDRPYYKYLEDADTLKLEDTMLEKTRNLLYDVDREKSDSDLDLVVISAIMRRTVRLNPKRRSLSHAVKVMDRSVMPIAW
jgi:serine/threonine protein kinase